MGNCENFSTQIFISPMIKNVNSISRGANDRKKAKHLMNVISLCDYTYVDSNFLHWRPTFIKLNLPVIVQCRTKTIVFFLFFYFRRMLWYMWNGSNCKNAIKILCFEFVFFLLSVVFFFNFVCIFFSVSQFYFYSWPFYLQLNFSHSSLSAAIWLNSFGVVLSCILCSLP